MHSQSLDAQCMQQLHCLLKYHVTGHARERDRGSYCVQFYLSI